MKKKRLTILNRSRRILYIEYQRCGQKGWIKVKVKRRLVLRLSPEHYAFCLGYDGVNLVLDSKLAAIKDCQTGPSIANPKYKGVKLLVNSSKSRMKLKCNEIQSIGDLIESI